jgi:glycosyltransferase involved in cell wall biosynthesis
VPPGDTEALARALGALVVDPVQRAELGRRARVTAGRYRAGAIVPQFIALYDEVGAARC